MDREEPGGGSWTLLTAHGHALVEIARNGRARIRDIAAAAGTAERTAQAIVAGLETAGCLTRTRAGRRTVCTVHPSRPFRHPAPDGHRAGPLRELPGLPGAARDGAGPPRGGSPR